MLKQSRDEPQRIISLSLANKPVNSVTVLASKHDYDTILKSTFIEKYQETSKQPSDLVVKEYPDNKKDKNIVTEGLSLAHPLATGSMEHKKAPSISAATSDMYSIPFNASSSTGQDHEARTENTPYTKEIPMSVGSK